MKESLVNRESENIRVTTGSLIGGDDINKSQKSSVLSSVKSQKRVLPMGEVQDEHEQMLKARTQSGTQQRLWGDQELSQEQLSQLRSGPSYMLGEMNMSGKRSFVLIFIFILNLPGISVGYALCYQNQLAPLFKAKYGWADGYQTDVHNSILGSSIILGMALGAVSGGLIMQIGRRRTLFISLFIGIMGNLLTINVLSFIMVNIGRFLFGYASGLMTTIVPRYMGETLPDHLSAGLIAGFIAAQAFGALISNLFVFLLPEETETELLREDTNWLIIYVYFPVSVQVLTIFCMLTIIRYEPIKFLIANDRMDEARKAIQQTYKYATSEAIADKYIEAIRSVSGKSSSNLTLSDALCNKQYRRSTWINVGYMVFHELTGINVINMYSYQIFKETAEKNPEGALKPTIGVIIVGIVNFFSLMTSTCTVKIIGRRTLLIGGHIGIALVHAGVGISDICNQTTLVVIMVLIFMFIYENSSGPVAWVYAAETTIDAGMGLCLFTLWSTVLILTIICPIMMDRRYLGPDNTFFIFSGLSVIGATYSWYFIKETKGLTEKEKKQILIPEKYRQRSGSKAEKTTLRYTSMLDEREGHVI